MPLSKLYVSWMKHEAYMDVFTAGLLMNTPSLELLKYFKCFLSFTSYNFLNCEFQNSTMLCSRKILTQFP